MTSYSQNPSDWAQLAELLRPQGRRGELLAEPLTDLDNVFSDNLEVWLSKTDTPPPTAEPIRLESHWFPTGRNAGRIVLKLSSANTISEAEALEGLRVLVPATAMPTLDADTYFVRDLLGCTLFDKSTPIGEITDVQFAVTPDGRTRLEDAAPILVITPASPSNPTEPEEFMVPFIRAWLLSIDLPNKRLTMDLPAGLLEP